MSCLSFVLSSSCFFLYADLDDFIEIVYPLIKDSIDLLPNSEIQAYAARQLLKASTQYGKNIGAKLQYLAQKILAKQLPEKYLQYIIRRIIRLARPRNVVKSLTRATVKEGARELAGEVAKQGTLKAASKAGWECAKKVPKPALFCGAVVDTAVSAVEIYYAYQELNDGDIDQREFRRRSVRSVSSAAGSTAGGVGGATVGTYIGATIGTILVPGAGTGFGGMVGGFIGTVLGGTGGAMVGGHVGECIHQELER